MQYSAWSNPTPLLHIRSGFWPELLGHAGTRHAVHAQELVSARTSAPWPLSQPLPAPCLLPQIGHSRMPCSSDQRLYLSSDLSLAPGGRKNSTAGLRGPTLQHRNTRIRCLQSLHPMQRRSDASTRYSTVKRDCQAPLSRVPKACVGAAVVFADFFPSRPLSR